MSKDFTGIPTRIRIGSEKYSVILKKNLVHPDGSKPYGYCSRGKEKTIYLDSSKDNNSNIADTLLHEIIHAIWQEYYIGDTKKCSEEGIVSVISSALTSLMINNPKLSNYFHKQWNTK